METVTNATIAASSPLGLNTPYSDEFDNDRVGVLCAGFLVQGLHMAISGMTYYFSAKQSRKTPSYKRYLIFVALLIVFGTLNFVFSVTAYFLDKRPASELSSRITLGAAGSFLIAAQVMGILVTILCNSLLIYRCYIIWNKRKKVLILPVLVFASAIGVGLYVIIRPISVGNSLLYILILVSLNAGLSSLIFGRVIWIRRRVNKLLGTNFKGQSGGVVTIIVESSLLYTLTVIMSSCLVPVKGRSLKDIPLTAFDPLLILTECIASELIILRVVLNRTFTQEWTNMTFNEATTGGAAQHRQPIRFTHSEVTAEVEAPKPAVLRPLVIQHEGDNV